MFWIGRASLRVARARTSAEGTSLSRGDRGHASRRLKLRASEITEHKKIMFISTNP